MREKMRYATFLVAGIRNKPGRNLATLFCFGFIAANVFSGQFLLAGASGCLDRGVSRMGADHLVVPSQYLVFLRGSGPNNTIAIVMAEPSIYRMKADIMERVGTVQGISAMSPQLYVSTLRMPELSPVPVNIYGIDPETDFAVSPWLQKPLGSPLKPGEVIIGRDITGEVSTQITLGDRIYTIAGKLDPTQSPVDHTIFLPLDEAYSLATVKGIVPPSAPQISPGDVNAVLVQDAPGENQDIVGGRIKRFLASSPEYRYISVIGKHFSLDPVARDIQALPGVLNAISAFVVVITLPLIALIAAMVAHERQREIGILKAMGAKRNSIFFIVIAESLVLAATGGLAGVMVSYLALSVMEAQGMLNSALQVTFRMPAPVEIGAMAGLAFLVVITLGSISSLWPAYRSSMMNPYDAIRGEG